MQRVSLASAVRLSVEILERLNIMLFSLSLPTNPCNHEFLNEYSPPIKAKFFLPSTTKLLIQHPPSIPNTKLLKIRHFQYYPLSCLLSILNFNKPDPPTPAILVFVQTLVSLSYISWNSSQLSASETTLDTFHAHSLYFNLFLPCNCPILANPEGIIHTRTFFISSPFYFPLINILLYKIF